MFYSTPNIFFLFRFLTHISTALGLYIEAYTMNISWLIVIGFLIQSKYVIPSMTSFDIKTLLEEQNTVHTIWVQDGMTFYLCD